MISVHMHRVEGIEFAPIIERARSDGETFYYRTMEIRTTNGVEDLTLFADTREALQLPHERLDVQQRDKLEAQVNKLMEVGA